MTGFQSARDDVRAEGIAEWMERRCREVAARGPDAELAETDEASQPLVTPLVQ